MAIINFGTNISQSIALAKEGAKVRHSAVIGENLSWTTKLLRKNGVDTEIRQTEEIKHCFDDSQVNDYVLLTNQCDSMDEIIQQAHDNQQKIIFNFTSGQTLPEAQALKWVHIFILNYTIGKQLTQCREPISIIRSLVNLYPQGAFVFIHEQDSIKYIDSRQRVTVPFDNEQFDEDAFIGCFIAKLMAQHPIEYCLKYAISIKETQHVSESV